MVGIDESSSHPKTVQVLFHFFFFEIGSMECIKMMVKWILKSRVITYSLQKLLEDCQCVE